MALDIKREFGVMPNFKCTIHHGGMFVATNSVLLSSSIKILKIYEIKHILVRCLLKIIFIYFDISRKNV
jgi:hypothetical protein